MNRNKNKRKSQKNNYVLLHVYEKFQNEQKVIRFVMSSNFFSIRLN